MLLTCDEASTDNRWLELKRTRVSVSTQVYILQGRTGLYFSSLTKKNLCFKYDPPLHKPPFLCKRHSLSEEGRKQRRSRTTTPGLLKGRGQSDAVGSKPFFWSPPERSLARNFRVAQNGAILLGTLDQQLLPWSFLGAADECEHLLSPLHLQFA